MDVQTITQKLPEEKIILIQDSWEKLGDRKIDVPGNHYQFIFDNHPDLKVLFTTDLKTQKFRFLESFNNTVLNLNDTEDLIYYYKILGFKHKGYKVKKRHYPIIRDSIIMALGKTIGDEFSGELKEAWTDLIHILTDLMLEGAKARYLPKRKRVKKTG